MNVVAIQHRLDGFFNRKITVAEQEGRLIFAGNPETYHEIQIVIREARAVDQQSELDIKNLLRIAGIKYEARLKERYRN